MMLILTHENADFDAVASQWAAHRLYPEGVPLLSWRVNRNIEQFLALYWDAFEFVRPRDWQRQRVEKVILVDTLALPSVRGIRPDRVAVQVIDHHDITEDRHDKWTYRTEPVGATTTLLVEMLQATGLSLNRNEATLLILGVYEDTGSLIYDTTTARDVQAAAWLIEQGAQLPVVRRFLNIPLSEHQQELYERLQESIEWIKIEGQMIVLAAVEAPVNFDDEISAVAHRLRDALAPDGMFLLVQLKYDHVQLVARSSTDEVDVAAIARALGGGGHSRAAAATIMDRDMATARREIIRLLPGAVKPMVKVAQIMSYGVQTVTTTTTIAKAAEQMQRFGHEGYPVVDPLDGRLVGLLTRRIVDRAMNHQLGDMPVEQVMKVGGVTVRPSDSVELVQRLMISEGWGQIPVIPDGVKDGNNFELIGIVTRTDLINLLTEAGQRFQELNLRQLMADSFPHALWQMVQVVSSVSDEMEMPLYFVGGLVRDLLLGKPATDIDLVVEGDAIKLVHRLQARFGGETRSHAQFGTSKWLLSREVWQNMSPKAKVDSLPPAIDFVTARTEFYTRPSALPEVERGSIKLDLHRRDFTINTLAIRLDGAHLGELLDFYGGRRDLESGLVRVLHSLSFVDDPTRILRAARLEQRLNFKIEPRTAELIMAALPMLNRVTGDRIRHELEMCLREAKRNEIMARLAELGVLAQIHPGLTWHYQTAESFSRAERILAEPAWSGLLRDQSPVFVFFALLLLPLSNTVQQEAMARLKVRKATHDDVVSVQILLSELTELPVVPRPSQVYRILRPYIDRVLLTALAAVGLNSNLGRQLDRYNKEWRHYHLALTGSDLLGMGLKPGPRIGNLLERLLVARLDGLIEDEMGERSMLKELLASEQSETNGAC